MKIAIIAAMEEETAVLQSKIQNCVSQEIAGNKFYSGQLEGKDIVLLQGGIGKVAAAIGTTLLMEKFNPTCVINTGSAGGFSPNLKVGDIVISSEVRYHDADVTAFGYEIGQLPQLPAAFKADLELIKFAEESINDHPTIQAETGLICSGDIFLTDPAKIEICRQNFPQMIACEMEAAAVAHVCHKFNVPFVVLRALSDIAGKSSAASSDEFLGTAAENSSQFVQAMLAKL